MYKVIITSKDFNYESTGNTEHAAVASVLRICPDSMNPWQARITLYKVYTNETSFIYSCKLGAYLEDITE